MTATAHALTGAAVALAIKQPAAAIPLAFLSHFALDAFPHFKVDSKDALDRNSKKLFWVGSILDVLIVIGLLIFLPNALSGVVTAATIFWCMAAAISPDLPWVYRLYGELKNKQIRPGNMYSRFHIWIQWKEVQWGIWVELVWILLMLTAIAHLKK